MDPLQFDQETMNRIKAAQAAGVPQEQIFREATDYQMRKAQRSPIVQKQEQPKSNILADLLPLIGGVAGSFIPGLGTIVGGAAGAGIGTLLKQGMKGQQSNWGEVGKEALLGGAGGVLGEGLGWLGGRVASKVGSGLVDAGTETGIRALRLNKGQLAGFLTKHGEDAGQFLAKEGAIGKTAAQLTEQHIEPLQQTFNSIAKTSGIRVNPNTFMSNINEQAQRLIEAGGTENAKIAKDLIDEASYIMTKDLSPAGYDISKVDSLRQTFAKQVNWNDPIRSTKSYALADALRKTSIDAANEAGVPGLRDIGIKLSKYRDLEKAAIAQEQLGRGNLPAGITKWLSIGAGVGAAGPVGGAAGLVANNVVNSPDFLRFLSQNMVKGGQAIQSGSEALQIPGQIATQGAGQGTAQLLNMFNGAPSAEAATMNDMGIPRPSTMMPSSSQAQNPNLPTSNAQDETLKQVLAAIMFSKAKNVSDIKTAYEFMNPTSKPLAAEQQKLQQNALSGLNAIGTVKTILSQDPNAPLKSKIPFVKGRSPYAAAAKEVADVYTRLRTGAALNKGEQDFYDSQLPQPFDAPDTIAYKLQLFESLFTRFAYGQTPAGNDVNFSLPSPY